MKPVWVMHCIHLGMFDIERPFESSVDKFTNGMGAVYNALDGLGFHPEATQLLDLYRDYIAIVEKKNDIDKTMRLDYSPEFFQFDRDWRSFIQTVWSEINSRFRSRYMLVLDDNPVITSLRILISNLTVEEEKIIAEDALRCLETGSYRSATVMGWNLVFERLRQWIFTSHRKVRLNKFNAILMTHYKNKNNLHEPIKIYEDFYVHSERYIIEIAYEAELFPKHKHQILLNALTDRNHFAHPTTRQATSATAAGYVENLIINILNDPLFNKPPKVVKPAEDKPPDGN
ncbi:hypothetical protein P12x_001555 [Tundrisphaera lichenicola]|uniref:hypothetical protein n=1 Tax=Tundrisphaera lichenicola TaxID=2029860 RepID=UPI003EBF6756